MLSRSILDILVDLSSFITVPEAHVRIDAWRRRRNPRWARAGPSGPSCGSGAVPSGRPTPSWPCPTGATGTGSTTATCRRSALFSFLMFVFTLVETGGKGGAPVLTIPTQ